ncbi:adenylate/guanylate cyclase domain-containing protein [Bradyrhizobium sp.]|uniref:adenylate/guanylate cyclase domain-containing protein n=1 Tax=Bradyrhizobium sp. TaxID=376 RepID=UPI0025C69F8A|nr:adenylate/guanylate cyclase domain-containing protein [Bradyrhizobium sp.]
MPDFELPETHYALSGDVNIAYSVMGDAPIDLVLVHGIVSHIEAMHELLPGYTDFMRRLAKFARVITFDKRGQGLSDRISDVAPLEQRMDDVRAVMDAVGSQRAALLGWSEGASMSAMFAATYPERISRLILYGSLLHSYNRNLSTEEYEAKLEKYMKAWGNGDAFKPVAPSQMTGPEAITKYARLERLCSSPGPLKNYFRSNRLIDVTAVLPTVRVPTLVMHRLTDAAVPVAMGRAFAESIPGAKYIEYPTGDHGFWAGDFEGLIGDIEEFVTGHREGTSFELDRVLATVLFTDIADSTRSATAMGDQRWRQMLDRHDSLASQVIEKHRGKLIKTTGDGVLATFDGPGRAVRCALAFSAAAQQIDLPLRAGLHTGEIEIRGKDIAGVAVHADGTVQTR